jgi:integrase
VHYLRYARLFSTWLPGSVEQSLPQLSAGQVIDFVRDWTSRRRSAARDMVVLPALRSLLAVLARGGQVRAALAGAVPAGRGWPRSVDRPRAARSDDIRAVLAGCDRSSAVGRRDYAILLMLARLAVRGGEVARLKLGDVNWRAGELMMRGKGGRVDVLPLPADVGAAMADYLMHARPATLARNLFVTVKAPFTGLAVSSVTVLVAAACARAGVPRSGRTGCGTRRRVTCSQPARRWRRSASCCATRSSAPPRSMPAGPGQPVGDAANQRRAGRMRRRVEPGARPEGEHPPVLDAARLLELLRSEPLVVTHDGRMPRVTDSRQFTGGQGGQGQCSATAHPCCSDEPGAVV